MTRTTRRFALQARIVFPVATAPMENGVVTIEGDRIVAVGQNRAASPPRDLGDVAILPGLVNAHTHLEFSHLPQPIGRPGMAFPDWIAEVVARRRSAATMTEFDPLAACRESVSSGLDECLECGVTTVGDISTADLASMPMPESPVACCVFRELMALSPSGLAEQTALAKQHVERLPTAARRVRVGLSPHAPYTASRELVAAVCRLSRTWGIPVAMHVAESPEELRLLRTGTGPFRDLLQRLDAWVEGAFPGGVEPRDYLQLLSQSHRSLVIHGNYLSKSDWEFLAGHADRMSVVYCPRTHEFFRHAPYPLAEMLDAGVSMAVGTDSRASNPDLSFWQELRCVARNHPRVALARVLRMGTLDAAQALGCHDQVGSLEIGKRADLTIVRIDQSTSTDLYEALFDADRKVCRTMCGGRWVQAMRGDDGET